MLSTALLGTMIVVPPRSLTLSYSMFMAGGLGDGVVGVLRAASAKLLAILDSAGPMMTPAWRPRSACAYRQIAS